MLGNFIIGTGVLLPAGLLNDFTAGFSISASRAGLMLFVGGLVVGGTVGGGSVVSAFAPGVAVAITSPTTVVGAATPAARVVVGSIGVGTVTVTITVTVGTGPGIVGGPLGLVPGTWTMMTCGATVVTGPVLPTTATSVAAASVTTT